MRSACARCSALVADVEGETPWAVRARAPPRTAMISRIVSSASFRISQILELKDSLALTDAQLAKLTALRDSTAATYAVIADSIRAAVAKAGANADPARLFATMRPHLTKGRAIAREVLQQAQSILTPEQWAKVPERIRAPGGSRRGFGNGP